MKCTGETSAFSYHPFLHLLPQVSSFKERRKDILIIYHALQRYRDSNKTYDPKMISGVLHIYDKT